MRLNHCQRNYLEVVLLRGFEKLTIAEIAERFGERPGAVKSRLPSCSRTRAGISFESKCLTRIRRWSIVFSRQDATHLSVKYADTGSAA